MAQGRFEEPKRLGLQYVRSAQYDKAAGKLEEVWEQQQPPDAVVAEHLAIAYLNGEDRRSRKELAAQAYEIMAKAIALGGQATFMVNHSHERLGIIQGDNWTKYCRGRFSIKPGRVVFLSEAGDRAGEDSFDIEASAVREVKENSRSSRGVFQLSFNDTAGKKQTFNFAPRSFSEGDAEALLQLMKTHGSK